MILDGSLQSTSTSKVRYVTPKVTSQFSLFPQVFYILDTLTNRLAENPDRKFMYVETGFFERWWISIPKERQDLFRKFVANGQLEFVNGGWYVVLPCLTFAVV